MKVTRVAKSTMCDTLKKFRQSETTDNGKSTGGRLPKLSYREEKKLNFLSRCQPKASIRELLELLDPNKKVSTGLVRQKLIKAIIAVNRHSLPNSEKTTALVFEKSDLRQKYWENCFFPMKAHSKYIQEERSMFAYR